MSPKGTPNIGRPRSLHEREQEQIAAAVEAEQQRLDEEALDRRKALVEPAGTVEMSDYEREKEERDKQLLLDALKENRPPKPTGDSSAPESLSARVKPAPVEPTSTPEPKPVLEVPVPEVDGAPLAAALARQRVAQEVLALAQADLEAADAVLKQAQADHAAALAEQTVQRHRAVLVPALKAAQRQREQFQALFTEYGGAGRYGTTQGPLARLARTIPSGETRRREQLIALYRVAGELMESIRVGYHAAHKAVEACELALERGGSSDAAVVRFEQAGTVCEAAAPHNPVAVREACVRLLKMVKAVDGEPGPEVTVRHFSGEDVSPRRQSFAEGIGSPLPSETK